MSVIDYLNETDIQKQQKQAVVSQMAATLLTTCENYDTCIKYCADTAISLYEEVERRLSTEKSPAAATTED